MQVYVLLGKSPNFKGAGEAPTYYLVARSAIYALQSINSIETEYFQFSSRYIYKTVS